VANNRTRQRSTPLKLTVTDGGVNAGDPCLVGAAITGVAEAAKDGSNVALVHREGTFSLSVKGVITGPANSAVAVGDKIFYSSGHTPKLDKDTGGVFFGYALGTVTSGGTATIEVALAGGSAS
jgi:hypothetical protein